MDENTSDDEDDTHFTLKKSIDPSKFAHLFRLAPKLTASTNYATWTSIILRSLQTVALHVYLSPDFTIPSGNTPNTKHHPVRWQKANSFVCMVLTAAMSEEIQNQIGHLPTAAEMWAEARRLYASATATDWTLAIRSLVTTRYTDGDDVAEHISEMKGYRRDLTLMNRDIDDDLFACFLRISMSSTWDDVFATLSDRYTSSEAEQRIRDEYGVRTGQSTASSFHATRSKTGKSAAAEEARKQAQREEEAAERARLRAQQAKTGAAGAWRRTSAQMSEHQRLKVSAGTKLEEKEKRHRGYAVQKEAEMRQREEEEAAARKAEERLRAGAGAYPLLHLCMRQAHGRMAERVAAEEAVAAQKREEERLNEQRRRRELERAAAAEEARKKAQREEEAAERARLRSRQAKTGPAPATADGVWRRAAAQTSVPPRTQIPAGPPKTWVAPGGWRQRMAEKEQQAAAPAAASASPATTNAPLPDTKNDTDGKFEMVPEKNMWKPTWLWGA